MTKKIIIWGVMMLGCTVPAISDATEDHPPEYMSKEDREILKEEARDMFYHAYNAYMDNAYPADELMPLSCKGRYRGSEADRGDIDSTLGNFSLTLVDTLDTLVVLGDLGEFENAVRLVVKDVSFDTDVIVSLFETNIRMLGGLLSAHILAEYLQSRADIMPWYRGELLNLAKDLGYRFLPAFNTTTGIPFGRINLRHGMKGVPAEMCRETCTACAGSMILEMAALSRLTGESIFEDKAQKAMDALWKMRHRGTDLMGSVLNVHSGDWVRRDSGVGAGIDSYYEYCLKAYILLGDEKYLGRFNKHYQAVMKYVSQGPMLLDVHMHRPNTNSKNFMDALLAFWPGLQVLKGDIKPAVETHEMLYQVLQRHNFIPEAFTTDFQVHWGHHPLRPEFLESTYFLYRATGDHYYLGVGRKVLKSLQTYARVPCGYAAVSDVRTNKHDDTMESFVLSETLKYLYLLFTEPNDLVLDIDEFIFTTEGHLLPLTLAAARANVTADLERDVVQIDELGRTCPNSLHLFPASVRQPLRNMVEDVCPRTNLKRRLNASQFQANNLEHLKILSNMGITILTPTAGRVQVLHTFSNARTAQDAEEGLLFMQEMVELSKKQSQQTETRAQTVTYERTDTNPPRQVTLLAGPAHFGPTLKDDMKVTGIVEFASPSEACDDLLETEKLVGKIVMVSRGNCMFVEKARRIQKAGAIAGIVLDTVMGSSAGVSPMFAMSGDGKDPDDVTIPMVFLFNKEATDLIVTLIANDGSLTVTLGDYAPRAEIQLKAPDDLSVFERLKGSLKDFLVRQITPQNTGVSRPSGIQGSSETIGLTGGLTVNRTEDHTEYEIYGLHLKAKIMEKSDIVEIIKTDFPPPKEKIPRNLDDLEKTWHRVKQDLINSIYTSEKSFATLTLEKIRFQYSTMQKHRGTILNEEIQVPTVSLLEWLLREFIDIPPNDEESSKTNNHEVNSKPSMVENVEEILARMRENEKSKDSIDLNEELRDALAQSLSVHYFDFKLSHMDDSNKDLRDILAQSLNLRYFDFKRSHVEEIEKCGEEKIESSEKRKIAETNSDTFVITHGGIRATIFTGSGIVRMGIVDHQKKIIKKSNDQSIDLEDFERKWYNHRQFLVDSMYLANVKSPFVEIPIKIIDAQYRTLQILRNRQYQDNHATLEDMILWYLREINQVDRYAEMMKILEMAQRVENDEGKSEKLENPDAIEAKDAKERKTESFVIEEIGINREKNVEEREINPETDKNDESSENIETFDRKFAKKQAATTNSQESPIKKDSAKCLAINNENVEKSRCNEKVENADDPLEEFKKPIWANDDHKDTARSFSQFQGKTDLPNSNYEYPSEYSAKVESVETTVRQKNKRIEDDL